VLEPVSPADQAIIDDPWGFHDRDPLWRPRFQRTGLFTAVPLARAHHWARLQHDHVTPLTGNPNYTAAMVCAAVAAQPLGADGHPQRWCGVCGAGGEWLCAESYNVYFLCTRCSGNRSRTVNRFDFKHGAPPCGVVWCVQWVWGGRGQRPWCRARGACRVGLADCGW
jgi:hypothetical protein